MPLLGAPQPTKTTSDCPCSAFIWREALVLFLELEETKAFLWDVTVNALDDFEPIKAHRARAVVLFIL
eukprot:CAMPEP_0195510270 /NCGR_PEP_ID=MMETSP0794_2-20130614/2963_1 /TAXON_ID=515487 /ORGANISM="Stephanopyxis turris, Strain CCMP 815" /LENGTH=67 /DNA_ID=CAMNT_0040637655 /DNA_START=326 /DNA_END=529 /DNA_ORIENTATION=-